MTSIIRYSPVEDVFDDLFRAFWVRPVERDYAPRNVAIDVSESDSAYQVKAELPGVKKDEINVTIDGKNVAITAEVKNEKEVKDDERMVRSERYYGKVYRAFTLAQDVDESGAQAKYTDGVLELTLPKKAAAQAKKLTIQ